MARGSTPAPIGKSGAREPAKPSAAARLAAIAAHMNARQRAYLLAVYDIDQAREAANRGPDAAPASVWRWIEYGPDALRDFFGDRELRAALQAQGLVDSGSGATWSALASHGLIERKHRDTPLHLRKWDRTLQILFVRMTSDGRKVARLVRGEPATRPRAPKALSLTALRLVAYGQAHPGTTFDWQVPWAESYWQPDYMMAHGVCQGLIKRGLLAGTVPNQLRITPAGQLLDVTAEPNWKPPKASASAGNRPAGTPGSAP